MTGEVYPREADVEDVGMDGLRDDQSERLARHASCALERWALASSTYRGEASLREYPEGRALLAATREDLTSVAIAAAASTIEMRQLQRERAGERGGIRIGPTDVFPLRVLEALGRRRLPFAPEDIELVLDLGTSTMREDDGWGRSFEVLAFGAAAATKLLADQPGSPPVLAGLGRAVRAVDALGIVHTSDPGRLVQRMRALLAANMPGGLLDLSVLANGDEWGEDAAETLRRHAAAWASTPDVLALLARARGARPTQAWKRDAASLAQEGAPFAELLRELLEPILEIDVTTSTVPWPPAWLLAPENEVLVRGAAWATSEVQEAWVVPLLGRIALRCAAPSPHPTVTTALSHSVAGGAIEALAARRTPEAHAELRGLLQDIRRRDLLKRIAAIVGEEPELTTTRDERIRREKRRAVQRKANLEPKERQRVASAYVRRDLRPILVEAGFTDVSGRTFWRTLDDRVERLHCKAHAGGLTLELGIWLPFVPRWYTVAEKDGRIRPTEFACDLRGNVHAWHDDLPSAAAKAEAWFGRWRPLPVVLRWLLEGTSSDDAFHWGAPGSPVHATLVGYLALELDEEELGRSQLARVVAHYDGNEPSERTATWDAWFARVREDAAHQR
jgi:hypothetical protein